MAVVARKYAAEDRPAWDDLVRRSRTGHFLFLRDYMDYHADRFVDASLLVFEDDRLVAALPANRSENEVVSHGGLTFGGVIAGSTMGACGMLRAFDAVLEHLRDTGVERLVYKPVPHAYHIVPAEDDLYAVFRAGGRLVGRDLASVIRLDERLPYSKGRRSTLKRARTAGLSIGRSDSFEAFVALATENLERHRAVPTHSSDELALLAARFPENIKLVVAILDKAIVAGVLVYETPVLAHTQYIASSDVGKEVGAVDVLIDTLIEEYAGNKRWFEFGISTEESGSVLNVGLVRNKESYGARALVYDRYLVDV
jgi:hypothetical protein